MSKMGVYGIENRVTGRTYIGSSTNITSRFSGHRRLLRSGKHDNDVMIEDWRKYGEHSFEMRVIEIVEEKFMLLLREEFWIKETMCSGKNVYNKIIRIGSNNRPVVGIRRRALWEVGRLVRHNPQAGIILMLFIEHMDEENTVRCTYDYMQRYFKCSRATVYRSIKYLVNEGFVAIEKAGTMNVYRISQEMFQVGIAAR